MKNENKNPDIFKDLKLKIRYLLEDYDWMFCLTDYETYYDFLADCIETVIKSDILTDVDLSKKERASMLTTLTVKTLEENNAREIYTDAINEKKQELALENRYSALYEMYDY